MTKVKPITLPEVGKSQTGDSGNKPASDKPKGEAQNKEVAVKPTKEELNTSIIVFGRDDKNKAHASRFGEANRAAAIKAAYLMGFRAMAISHDAIRNIAEDLPEGRLFDSGKGFVPFVREGACLALEGHAKQFPRDIREPSASQIETLKKEMAEQSDDSGKPDDKASNTDPVDDSKAGKNAGGDNKGSDTSNDSSASGSDHDTTTAKSEPFAGWLDISVGTIVLAVDDPEDGWWEAKVTHAHKSGIGKNIITMLTLEWVNFPDEATIIRRSNEVAYFAAGYGQDVPATDDASNNAADSKTAGSAS